MYLINRLNAKRFVIFSFLLFFTTLLPLFAQSEDWFYGKKIKSIKFSGLHYVSRSDVSGITKGFLGKEFSDDVYFELLSRIGALDYFESFDTTIVPSNEKYEAVEIIFTVIENPIISKVSFVGNKRITRTDLLARMKMKEKDIFSETDLEKEVRTITDHYLSKGFTNIHITTKWEETANREIEITFLINEGIATSIRSIKFEGNQIISERTLLGTMKLKPRSLFSKGSFQETKLEADKQAILTYYLNRGYVDADIIDVIREDAVDEKGNSVIDLTFVLTEGYQYTYAGVQFEGNYLFSSEYLESKFKMSIGDVFNYTKFNEYLSNMSDAYYENGYLTTVIIPEPYKDDDLRQISHLIHIQERSRSHVESITVVGNKRTKDNVVLREVPIQPGDVFSRSKLMDGMRNLYNLQYFSDIIPDVVPGSEDDLMNIVFNVEEQSTTSIEGGITFSGLANRNTFPISLIGTWKDTNLLGTGRQISVTASLSFTDRSLGFTYGDNWLFNMPIGYSSSIKASWKTETTLQKVYTPRGLDVTNYNMTYDAIDITLDNSIGKRWYPEDMLVALTGGLSNSFIRNRIKAGLVPVDSTISDYNNKWGFSNAVWSAFSVDKRDNRYFPTSGWFAKESLTWTGLIPKLENQFYLRSDTIGEAYFTLFDIQATEKWNFKAIFALVSGITALKPKKYTTISSSNKLSIDGAIIGRGWDDIYSTKGDFLWTNSLELRVPVLPNIISAQFFLDAVALKPNLPSMSNKIRADDFYFSFGPGIRSLIQQLPLSIYLVNTFTMKNGRFNWGNGKNPEWKPVLSFTITNF
ncbi:MAG: outer membrane protein assembly factor BamA [Treponema sp.]|nr:outer membrane protein assembly factor BamA [Treponema sp.]